MRLVRSVLFLATALLPFAVAARCELDFVELPVTMSGLRPLVAARINDADVNLIVDSGAFYSMISEATLDQLKLVRRRAPDYLRVDGVGGRAQVYVTRVARFRLKKTEFQDVEFLVQGNEFGPFAQGLLGQNFLGASDIEYDLANGAVRLAKPGKECADANLAYWAGTRPVVALELDSRDGLAFSPTVATAYVNGQKIRVMVDSGASTSLLSLDAARRAALVPDGKGVVAGGSTHGVGSGLVRTWIAPVDTFAIGGEKIQHTHLRFGDMAIGDEDMLLGADFLLAHRVYVANSQHRIYFTYNGGPIFDLSVHPDGAPAPSGLAAVPAEPEPDQPPMQDAAGYARRGAAFIARRDFPRAIADLARACALDPGSAGYFRLLGQAHSAAGASAAALVDWNEALRLDPSDIEPPLARARLLSADHKDDAALADIDAADALSAAQSDARLELADLYLRVHRPQAAVEQLDRWIFAHGHDVRVPAARRDRCRGRALLGRDLDKALADCNAALDAGPEQPGIRATRGLVQLRLGHPDKALADYDAALRAEPDLAWALYGRGLIRQRQGALEAAQADFAQAGILDPTIEENARRYGIAP